MCQLRLGKNPYKIERGAKKGVLRIDSNGKINSLVLLICLDLCRISNVGVIQEILDSKDELSKIHASAMWARMPRPAIIV